jgi:hypothetical protein
MTRARLIAMIGALGLAMAGMSAHAQSVPPQVILAANDFATPAPAPTGPGRTLEWDQRKGRWGLKLGMEPRIDRDTQLRDVAPGVFYKLTPRLHIGGAVTLAPDNGEALETQWLNKPQAPNPRVRLETTFKF